MVEMNRREVLKCGAFASAAAFAPKWAKASGSRNVALNRAAWASSSADFINTGHMSTDGLATTMWKSADADEQWIYVDLGADCSVHSAVLRWGSNYPLDYKVQVSSDIGPSPETGLVENWADIHKTVGGRGGAEQITFPETRARYVRLALSSKAKPGGYELSSFEVYGAGGFEAVPVPLPPLEGDGTLRIEGGWRLINQANVKESAAVVSISGYDDSGWLIATVPGTVLTTYLNLGAIPDPFYGDYLSQISDFFSHTNWWYRNELEIPQSYSGKRIWLNFDGINFRAFVYLNGTPAGDIDGAFMRGRFDVTKLVTPGKKNCIAVLIMPVPKPDKVMPKRLSGYDWPAEFPENEPTILPSGSWDWLPTIRDRNTGIWNHVALTTSGDVTIENVFAVTHFPDPQNLTHADLTLCLDLRNYSGKPCKGELHVRLGAMEFSHAVSLRENGEVFIKLDQSKYKQLSLVDPKLWWPSGHGEQNLYDLILEFRANGQVLDVNRSRIGIREFSYSPPLHTKWDPGAIQNGMNVPSQAALHAKEPLSIACNGKRIFVRGANWGMDEGMLRCDREGFRCRVRMEKEMNFNLIRNWSGDLDKTEFYEVCDELGIMVWEEFGISNGLMPDDPSMWLRSARDRILRRRNHACVALWCAANETAPQDPILTEMPRLAEELDGTRIFLQFSTQIPPTDGDGPYETKPATFYFNDFARGFRPELGSATIPAVETMRRMMPFKSLWPVNEMWGLHDWQSGYNGCRETADAIAAYGAPANIEDFCRQAQMVNTEVFKAIYEAFNDRMWNDCTGVMIWMSNPAWPSLTWNTYDYYKEPTAAYFACRKACEPIHIQWNCVTNKVKVINTTSTSLTALKAEAAVYNLGGSLVQTKTAQIDCAANSTQESMQLFTEGQGQSGALARVHFIHLKLMDASGTQLSTNFYWRSNPVWKYEDLQGITRVTLNAKAGELNHGTIAVDLANRSEGVALAARLKVIDVESGLLAAPVFYSDNYLSLVPQESRRVEIDLTALRKGRKLKLLLEGWNVEPAVLADSLVS